MKAVAEVHYRLATPARAHFPGHHRSRSGDGGFEFRGHAALVDAPDARRLDLHASLRDPFGQWMVRVHSLRQSIAVAMVVDLSASMGFVGSARKLGVVADLVESIAVSAWRSGDTFSFIGADAAVRDDLFVPATRLRHAGASVAERLRSFEPSGRSASGLIDAAGRLGRRRGLVFVVSDFHLPPDETAAVLASLAHHEVAPVVVWDRAEFEPTPRHGLAELEDPETRERRLVWWRPSLRDRWREAHVARREALMQSFHAARVRPLFIEDGFDASAVTRYFIG